MLPTAFAELFEALLELTRGRLVESECGVVDKSLQYIAGKEKRLLVKVKYKIQIYSITQCEHSYCNCTH